MSKPKDDVIAEEIITYKFTGKETLKDMGKIFKKIMKKHNIHQFTPTYNDEGKKTGKLGNRFEWTMYQTLWMSRINSWLEFYMLFGIKW